MSRARRYLATTALLVASATVGWCAPGCSLWTNADTARAADVLHTASTVACIVANAFLPSEADVIRACAIERELWPLVRPTMNEQKAALRRAAVSRGLTCP